MRLSSDERSADGLDGAACAAIAGALAADGLVDFVSATIGDSATYQGSVQIVPPLPEPANAIVDPVTALRAALPAGLPLVATTRIVDLADAERVLASGVCDVVGMTRALIADPDLVRKARAGRAADVVPCIGCNQGCIGHYHAEIPIACLANLRTGRERRLPARGAGAEPAVDTLVIGAGPAGLTAAIEAASAGSRVVLVERGDGVGGQLRLAGRCPAHAELWVRYRALVERDLARTGVELRLGTVADAALADGFARVVLATGARPYMPPLPPLPGMRVVQAWDAILDPSAVPADGLALVLDWGGDWSGLDAAEALAVRGRRVALASASPVAGETLHQYQRAAYLARLDRRDVALLPHRELAVDGDGVVLRNIYSGRLAPLPRGHDDARARAGPRTGRRSLAGARGPAGRDPRRRRARPALDGGGGARGRRGRAGGGPVTTCSAPGTGGPERASILRRFVPR